MEALSYPTLRGRVRRQFLAAQPGCCDLCNRPTRLLAVAVKEDDLQAWCLRCLRRQRLRLNLALRDLFL